MPGHRRSVASLILPFPAQALPSGQSVPQSTNHLLFPLDFHFYANTITPIFFFWYVNYAHFLNGIWILRMNDWINLLLLHWQNRYEKEIAVGWMVLLLYVLTGATQLRPSPTRWTSPCFFFSFISICVSFPCYEIKFWDLIVLILNFFTDGCISYGTSVSSRLHWNRRFSFFWWGFVRSSW